MHQNEYHKKNDFDTILMEKKKRKILDPQNAIFAYEKNRFFYRSSKWFIHIFRYKYAKKSIQKPLQSWDSALSNGEKTVENG